MSERLGGAIALAVWLLGVVAIFGWRTAQHRRRTGSIGVDESDVTELPYLERTHQDSYPAYAATTGRFVPGIGRAAGRPDRSAQWV